MFLVSELRRRQVFRAAAWYGGLAWLAIEVTDTPSLWIALVLVSD